MTHLERQEIMYFITKYISVSYVQLDRLDDDELTDFSDLVKKLVEEDA